MNRRGLTLLELIIVSAIILVLISILLPSLRSKGRPRCTANLRALGMSILTYAAHYNGHLPASTAPSAAAWLSDQPRLTAELILLQSQTLSPQIATANRRQTLYCPAAREQSPAALWNDSGTFVVTGYAWFNDRSVNPGAVLPVLDGSSPAGGAPPLAYCRQVPKDNAGRRVLIADWTLSDTPVQDAQTRWSGLTYPDRPGTYGTSHRASGRDIRGNIFYFDGHVEQRTSEARNALVIRQGKTAQAPFFWIPTP